MTRRQSPQVLATRGIGGYRQYRIPAMTVTPTGRIVVAYDARHGLDDLPAPADLVIRTSDNNGETWSPQQIVRSGEEFAGFGDPSLLVDADTGRMFLLHQATEFAGFFESSGAIDEDDPYVQQADLAYSDDDGATWTVRRITSQLKRAPIEGLFAASGHGCQIFAGRYAGRLLQPYVIRWGTTISAAVAFSDDHGDHWTLGRPVGAGTNESSVVALGNGDVVLNSRAAPYRLVATSRDGGATFNEPRPDRELRDPSDNGSVVRLDGRPLRQLGPRHDDALACAHNDDTGLRRNLTVHFSPDGGAHWPARCRVYGGSAGYSTLACLSDGRLGIFYEREGYSQLVFDVISAEAADEADEAVGTVEPDPSPFELTATLRFIRPAEQRMRVKPGEAYAIPLGNAADYSPSEWREIGQANTSEATQTIYSRGALRRNLPAPRPGLVVGDELRFAARIRNNLPAPVDHLRLATTADDVGEQPPTALESGDEILLRGIRRFVTDEHRAGGVVVTRLEVCARGVDGALWNRAVTLRHSIDTGLPCDAHGRADLPVTE